MPVAEQVAHDLHPVHQRPFDHLERPAGLEPCLLGVGFDVVDDAVDERVREPLRHRGLPPGDVELALRRLARHRAGEGDEPLGRVGPPGEDHVLDMLEQVRRDVLVDGELAGVDDSHVEPGVDGVVEEGGVHRLPHHLVAAEREREVRDAAARQRARAALLDQRQRRDEVAGEEVVLLDPGRDREDVGVEDDVLGREPGHPGEEVVGATADRDLSLHRLCLALLVEGHHHDGRPEAPHLVRLGEEVVLAFLQRDRVDDPLPLHAPETGLDHRPLRAVDHHRHARDLGLGRDQVQEPRHRGLRIQHPLVHVDVEQVRAAAHLLQRHVDGACVVVGLDQPPEPGRAGHVRALPHHHEAGVRPDRERLQARPPRRRHV